MSHGDSLFQPIDQKRVSDEAVHQITQLIEGGRLKPGDQLPGERDLTRQLSISRSAVREAIRLLESQGVLEVRPGLGTFVTRRTSIGGLPIRWSNWLAENRDQVLALLEVRGVLEPLAATLAAGKATLEEVQTMRDALDQISHSLSAGNIERAVDGDVRFHQLVSQCGGNPFLIELNEGINVSLIESRYAYYLVPGRADTSNSQHQQIVEAIGANDPESAARVMREHIQGVRDFIATLNFDQGEGDEE